MLQDVPEVAADLRELMLAEQVRFQTMEGELVRLFVIKRFGLDDFTGRQRELFAEPGERADRCELADPGMNRARRHFYLELLGNMRLGTGDGASEIVRGHGTENRRGRVLSARNLGRAEVPLAGSAVELLDSSSPAVSGSSFDARPPTTRAGRNHRRWIAGVKNSGEDCSRLGCSGWACVHF